MYFQALQSNKKNPLVTLSTHFLLFPFTNDQIIFLAEIYPSKLILLRHYNFIFLEANIHRVVYWSTKLYEAKREMPTAGGETPFKV